MVNYTLIRSHRRKRSLALRITDSGELIVRAPTFTPKLFIDHFVRSKNDWITKQRSLHAFSRPTPTPHFASEQELKDFVNKQLDHHSALMDLHPTEIKFKRVKSYWGNCHTSGRLTFNYALRYAPKREVEYVVIHELAHLKHNGHDKRFWGLVNNHCSHVKDSRKILRKISDISVNC